MYPATRFRRAQRLLAVSFSVAFCASALAQQPQAPALKHQPAELTPAATGAMMLGAATAGGRVVAVGDHGIVLLSDDGGGTFRQARSVPVRSTLNDVCFVDEKTGWAVGHRGVVLATSDGGETWQIQRSDTSVDQPLFSVHFKDKDQGWAVGLWSLVVATKDGGKTWNTVQLPPPPGGGKSDRNLFRIFANTRGTLFIAAEQGTVLRSSDGASWTYSATGYNGSFWSGVALQDGTILVGGLRGTVYRSTDDGRTWKQSESGVKSSITDLVQSGTVVHAVGLDGVSLESADSGATFTAAQREDRLPLTALAAVGDAKLVAFSKMGVVKDFTAGQAR